MQKTIPRSSPHCAWPCTHSPWPTVRSQPNHELLYQRRQKLPAESQYLLASAIQRSAKGETAGRMIGDLLRDAETAAAKTKYWFHGSYQNALALMAWSECSPKSPKTQGYLNRLLGDRDGSGHWRSTYTNSWSLRALTSYAQQVETDTSDCTALVQWGDQEHRLILKASDAVAQVKLPFAGDVQKMPLKVSLVEGKLAYLDLKVSCRAKSMPKKRSDRGFCHHA